MHRDNALFRLFVRTALDVGGGVYRQEDAAGEPTTEDGC